MYRRNRFRLRIGSWAVGVAVSVLSISAFPAPASPSRPDYDKYRFQLAQAQLHPSLNRDIAIINQRYAIRTSLSGMRTAVAAPAVSDENQTTLLPWTGLGANALGMFSGSMALLHLSAAAGTFLIVQSGLDEDVHNYFARHASIGNLSWPGVVVGAVFPVILGGGLLGGGLIGGSPELASAGSAVLEASLLAFSYSTILKALTGRGRPEPVIYEDDEARLAFHFGFLRGGIYWGWPSGHMLANTAAVTSLLTFYEGKTWLNVAGGVYLGYLFLSVLSHKKSSMHWFSDAVAGVLMGFAVGWTVGRDFRRRWEEPINGAAGLPFNARPQRLAVSFSFTL